MKLPLKTRSNSAFRLIYHLVLVTKFRRKSLTADILERMQLILRELLGKWECDLIEFGGEADHIHLLFETHPSSGFFYDINISYLIIYVHWPIAQWARTEAKVYCKRVLDFY